MRDNDDPTNEERAEEALKVMMVSDKYFMGDQVEAESLADLMADLLHLARRNGIEPDYVIRTAQMNFDAEVEEEAADAREEG